MLQAGDFGLTKVGGSTGRLIRIAQWLNGDGFADFEHAFVYVGNGKIVEAATDGAHVGHLDQYDPATTVYSSWDMTKAQRGAIVGAAYSMVGTPYSLLDYVSLALLRLHLRPPGLVKYVASTHHMICSQLVDEAYRRAGVQMFDDHRFPGDVTPADLLTVLNGPRQGVSAYGW